MLVSVKIPRWDDVTISTTMAYCAAAGFVAALFVERIATYFGY